MKKSSSKNLNKSLESLLDVTAARIEADKIADRFGQILNLRIQFNDLGEDVICSPMYGWLTVDDTDKIKEDHDTKFAFQYNAYNDNFNFTLIVIPSDNSVELMTEGGLAIDPFDGSTFEADCPQDGSFKISEWNKFDLSFVA